MNTGIEMWKSKYSKMIIVESQLWTNIICTVKFFKLSECLKVFTIEC